MKIVIKKNEKRAFRFCLRETLVFLCVIRRKGLLFAFHIQLSVGNARGDDQPYRRKCDQCVYDYGENAARAAEHGYEVKIEKAEKPPIQRADQYQNISDYVCDFHNVFFPSYQQFAHRGLNYAVSAKKENNFFARF